MFGWEFPWNQLLLPSSFDIYNSEPYHVRRNSFITSSNVIYKPHTYAKTAKIRESILDLLENNNVMLEVSSLGIMQEKDILGTGENKSQQWEFPFN